MNEHVFEESLLLLVYGMGGVLVFLLVLVFLMNLSAAFFKKYQHLFPETQPSAPASKPKSADGNEDIAIAIAAVRSFLK